MRWRCDGPGRRGHLVAESERADVNEAVKVTDNDTLVAFPRLLFTGYAVKRANIVNRPLERSEIPVIFVPIFLPMLDSFGVYPYFFAMLVALDPKTSFLTPPMAMFANYLKVVRGKAIELNEVFKRLVPYPGIVVLAMFLMYRFPEPALWVPDALFGP